MKHSTIILLTMLMSMVVSETLAYDIAAENADGITIYYNLINDGQELEVTSGGINKYVGVVNIPEKVSQIKVTRIGDDAFKSCTEVTSVIIPNSVTSIGKNAFQGCEKIKSVTIPNSLTTIGSSAFASSGITSVVIPSSTISIGAYAFYCCTSLVSLKIEEGIESINDYTFLSCYSLTAITIPNSVKSIGSCAFESCGSLKTVSIGDNVITIGNGAFRDCESITNLTIGKSVKTIGRRAFRDCKLLSYVNLPNSLITVQEEAFYGCAFKQITLPKSLLSIGDKCFYAVNPAEIFSFIEEPYKINAFESFTAKLHVPHGTLEKYKATDGWKDFINIEDDAEQCNKPIINYDNGVVSFTCETKDVEFISEIRHSTDVQQGNTSEIALQMPITTISVYAQKNGLARSETSTGTITWSCGQPIFNGFYNVTDDTIFDLNKDGKISTADIQVIINEMKK